MSIMWVLDPLVFSDCKAASVMCDWGYTLQEGGTVCEPHFKPWSRRAVKPKRAVATQYATMIYQLVHGGEQPHTCSCPQSDPVHLIGHWKGWDHHEGTTRACLVRQIPLSVERLSQRRFLSDGTSDPLRNV